MFSKLSKVVPAQHIIIQQLFGYVIIELFLNN